MKNPMKMIGREKTGASAAGAVLAIVVASGMVIGAPAIQVLGMDGAPTVAAAQGEHGAGGASVSAADPRTFEQLVSDNGGTRGDSVRDRVAAGAVPATALAASRENADRDQDLYARVDSEARTLYPQGSPLTLDAEAYRDGAGVVFDWNGTMRVTFKGLAAYDSPEAAGIDRSALNFDANVDPDHKYGGFTYQLAVLTVDVENVDASPAASDWGEFNVNALSLYNESSVNPLFATGGYFYAWSSADHLQRVTDRETGESFDMAVGSFALSKGESREIKIAFWVPVDDLAQARAGSSAFYACTGDTVGESSYCTMSKAVSVKMGLEG